jgi:hypothetical protein
MRFSLLVLFIVFLIGLLLPFTEGSTERRSLDINSITINFDRTDAILTVDYDLNTLPKLYILLMGSNSIEPRIKNVLSEFDYKIIKMDPDRAILYVRDISRFEKGYYLHDSRKFAETINTLYIFTPDSRKAKEFSNLNATPPIFYRS